MTDKIILKDGKELIGIANVIISEVDDKIYINNASSIESSIKGSLAVYYDDETSQLMGSGPKLIWNKDTNTLEVDTISSGTSMSDRVVTLVIETQAITTNAVNTQSVDSDYSTSKKIAVENWFGFHSKIKPNNHPFKFLVKTKNNAEALLLTSNGYTGGPSPTVLLSFEDDRVSFKNKTNIVPRTINSSIGEQGDYQGDIAIDENFIYYCIGDFDGITKIWKRCALNSW
jgi:hypothetical protein